MLWRICGIMWCKLNEHKIFDNRKRGSLFNEKRWFIYIIIGIGFGVFDFYYQGFIQTSLAFILLGEITRVMLILGIWLVPVIPIVLYETKVSQSRVMSALTSLVVYKFKEVIAMTVIYTNSTEDILE